MDVVDLRCFEHIERVDKYRFSAESGLTPLERILFALLKYQIGLSITVYSIRTANFIDQQIH